MTTDPKFYVYDPDTGDHTDITEPVSTDGLNVRPAITPDTIITLWGPGGAVLGEYPAKAIPLSLDQIQEIIDQGGQIWP